ncbi:hypothetical protein D1007_20614 [Hordeum vulgare]|nr:hypothetical protein D1007_20614 [Hordeum vulgare]
MAARGAAAAAHGVVLVVYLHLFGRAINSLHGRHIDQLFNDIKQDQKCIICRQYVCLSTVSYSYRFSYVCLELQQFRKKKDKKGPGKKAEADADEGASKAGANGEEAPPEPKSPVGLKFLAGESGSSHSTPFEDAMLSQEEQFNGHWPAAEEPSVMENADVVPVLDDADDRSVQNISITWGGGCEKLPISEESIMPQDSSQRDIADDGTNQVGVHQEVQVDSVQRTSSSDSKETMEVPIPSLDLRADNANMGEEGTREMEVGVSGRSSDGNIHDVEPTVSGETGMEVGHEAAMGLATSQEIPG